MQIQVLEKGTADLVYAGQHIYNIQTLIKELIENSIDAGSKNVQIIICDIGKLESVEITDDGEGIRSEDLVLIGRKNHTSKISNGSSYGYKGEALHCISECCQSVEIHTKRSDAKYGQMFLPNSRDQSLKLKARENGTTIKILYPFHKLPLRLKEWQRNKSSHLKSVIKSLKALALVHPLRIRFSVKNNTETVLFQSVGHQNIEDRIIELFNFDLMEEREVTFGTVSAKIYLGKSPNRTCMTIWNGRPLSQQVHHYAYNKIIKGSERYSIIVFLTDTSGNVYEVFAKSSSHAVILAEGINSIISTIIDSLSSKMPEAASQREFNCMNDYSFAEISTATLFHGEKHQTIIERDDFRQFIPIGQFNNSFIIAKFQASIEEPPRLVILDQHAIDERINYERVSSISNLNSVQTLISGNTRRLGILEAQRVAENKSVLEEYGFRFTIDQDGYLTLQTVPAICGQPLSHSGILCI